MARYLRILFSIFLVIQLLGAGFMLIALARFRQNANYSRLPQTPASGATLRPSPANASSSPTVAPTPPPTEPTPPPAVIDVLKLVIPVANVRPSSLRDTYNESRSEGRLHNAIDIMASRGTPVVAVADGEIIRFLYSDRGGNTIYQFSADKKMVFYYAHLDRYADGLTAGRYVRQGEVIGYVGDTGNAGAGNYHLHFAMWLVTDPKRYWDGVNINPYPILLNAP